MKKTFLVLKHDTDEDWLRTNVFYTTFSLSGVNAPILPGNWFWQVGLVVRRFYCQEANPKGSSLEGSLRYQKKKKNLF
jgi:hypothetical protein